MKKNTDKKLNNDELFELIKARAFELWNKEKCKQGDDWNYWFRAEQEIKKDLKKK